MATQTQLLTAAKVRAVLRKAGFQSCPRGYRVEPGVRPGSFRVVYSPRYKATIGMSGQYAEPLRVAGIDAEYDPQLGYVFCRGYLPSPAEGGP